MSMFKWNDLSKKEMPTETGAYLVYHKNEVIELSVWDDKSHEWKLHAVNDSPITHWTDYKKLGKPFKYQG